MKTVATHRRFFIEVELLRTEAVYGRE